MIKKVIVLSITSIISLSLVSCDPSKSYHNAIDKFEEVNDKVQETDVTGKFLRKSLEKNEKVNEIMQGENEIDTANNDSETSKDNKSNTNSKSNEKSEDNKTNFLGR